MFFRPKNSRLKVPTNLVTFLAKREINSKIKGGNTKMKNTNSKMQFIDVKAMLSSNF